MDLMVEPATTELFITRELRAPCDRVFAAWTDARQAALWWAPQGCTPLSCALDVRPGGAWHRRIRVPYADGTIDPETVVTVTFAETAQGTRLSLRHADFQSGDLRVGHQGGWRSCLERFAAFISSDR
jgi:uncharacterized protein YndB with AHSA1/START domain